MKALSLVVFLWVTEPFPAACPRCKGEGAIACPKHPKGAAEMESGASFCSIAARCTNCCGTLRVDCPDCHGKESDLGGLREDWKARAERQTSFEKEMGGVPRATLQGPRMQLTFEVESLIVGRRELSQHELAHLYLSRMEKLYEEFNRLLGLGSKEHRSKSYSVMVWRIPSDQKEASTRYTGGTSMSGSKLLGASPAFTMCRDRGKTPQDDDLHRDLVHNVTHLILSDLHDAVWLGRKKAGWVDEGLAHWFEDRGFGQCTNFCYQEQNTNVGFRGAGWRKPVREMVETGKMPPFAETANKMVDELKLEEHALAFSYVDFLLARDPKAFPRLVRILQQKEKATRDALKEAYDLSIFEFEEQWKRWVLENYGER